MRNFLLFHELYFLIRCILCLRVFYMVYYFHHCLVLFIWLLYVCSGCHADSLFHPCIILLRMTSLCSHCCGSSFAFLTLLQFGGWGDCDICLWHMTVIYGWRIVKVGMVFICHRAHSSLVSPPLFFLAHVSSFEVI